MKVYFGLKEFGKMFDEEEEDEIEEYEGICVRGRTKSILRPCDDKGSGRWGSISDWGATAQPPTRIE